ncbi:hypothetical protein A5788_22355 [Gordonia sp. 852002-50816_SCH5313054-c]|nr:hypothetical protein A5788_22355 [Gordonia sp. 852002-50816_SCH5313054-c]OBC17607.1 hypothetical protein A5786_18975 [Gordonia sp. 852002-50816_SCH5313054-a]
MTQPTAAVKPQDAALLMKSWLKTRLASRFPNLHVRLNHDPAWAMGSDPELVVFDDGSALNQWPVNTSPTIRITTWTTGRDVSIANHVLGLVLCTPITGIAKVLPGSSVIESTDSKTGADLASFTVRTRVRTVAL